MKRRKVRRGSKIRCVTTDYSSRVEVLDAARTRIQQPPEVSLTAVELVAVATQRSPARMRTRGISAAECDHHAVPASPGARVASSDGTSFSHDTRERSTASLALAVTFLVVRL